MGDQSEHYKLERRLLEVYPEAKPLVETIKKYGGMREVSIKDIAYCELTAYGDQNSEEGPFWTLLRDDSHHDLFHVMSFGLNTDALSVSFRRRCYSYGFGNTYNGNESREFLRDKIKVICQLYEGWFVDDRKLQSGLHKS